MDDVKIISGQADDNLLLEMNNGKDPTNSVEPAVDHDKTFYKNMIISFAYWGEQLKKTYSEENQETASGFVEAMEKVEKMLLKVRNIQNEELTIPQRDGLIDMLEYLKTKFQKRAGAVDANSTNY